MLRDALAAARQAGPRIAPGALDVAGLTSTPALADLAARAHAAAQSAMLTESDAVTLSLADVQRLADCAAAAAVHGYPRPALERLGVEAQALPAARTSDPGTSKGARPRVPSLRNALGRMLTAYVACGEPLTSEEAAARAGMDMRSEYSKRASELQALGYLRVVRDRDGREVTRKGATGRPRIVLEPTDDGVTLVRRLIYTA